MQNLGDMNNLYNMQDVILLCEIIENRFQLMRGRYDLNPRKCNSASSLSGGIQRDLSKVANALPTTKEIADIFEQTLTEGFSCVNKHLDFDTEILLPNSTKKTEDVLSKDYNCKVCYGLKLDEEKNWSTRRTISKILKLDENNHYGYTMTKPIPMGCIKKELQPTQRIFNILLERVDLNNPVGHLFVVDISFDYEKATPKKRIYNEIYPLIVEKQMILEIVERSVYQLMEQQTESVDGKSKSYRATKRAHAALFQKIFQPLYLERLSFLINRAR